MEDKQLELQEKREKRRKRRIRNQVISYIVVFLLFLLVLSGSFAVFKKISDGRQAKQEAMESSQEMIDNILASEEEMPIPEPVPSEEPVIELTPEQKLDEIVNAGIEVMPLEDKVAGLFIVTPESITGASTAVKAGQGTQKALAQYAVGGIIYTDKNIQSESQFSEMLKNTNLYTKYPIFLAVEEEGGKLSRFANKGIGEKVDSAAVVGQTGDVNKAYESGEKIGNTLSSVGINLNLAPVADVNSIENGYIGERAYGSDAQLVGSFAAAVSQGMQSKGVATCLKHFPGLGGNKTDPHKGISNSDRTEEQFRNEDFTAFKTAIESGAEMVMVSTMTAQALTGDTEPCVFSEKVVTDILREEMGFKGVIITDALNMKAISEYYDSEEAAVMALKAGCDMLLMPEDFEKAYTGVLNAVQNGTISEERINDALRRIYRIKYADKIEKVQ